MFGKRSDGKKIKTIDHYFKLIPHIMFERHDASNSMNLKVNCETLDSYIAKKRKEKLALIICISLLRVLCAFLV